MHSAIRLHRPAHLPNAQRHRRVLERLLHLPRSKLPEIPAAFRARAIRNPLRQRFKRRRSAFNLFPVRVQLIQRRFFRLRARVRERREEINAKWSVQRSLVYTNDDKEKVY